MNNNADNKEDIINLIKNANIPDFNPDNINKTMVNFEPITYNYGEGLYLLVNGINNECFLKDNLTTPYSISHNILYCKSNENIEIIRSNDTIIFDSIILPNNINNEDITSSHFQIYGNDKLLWDIPLVLLIDSIKYINNECCIVINQKVFGFNNNNSLLKVEENYFEFPLLKLPYQRTTIKLKSNKDFDYKLMTKNIYYDSKERKELAMSYKLTLNVFRYKTVKLKDFNKIKNVVCNNIYIKSSEPLTEYKYIINDTDCIVRDEFFIKLKHIKHDKNYYLYNFPFGVNEEDIKACVFINNNKEHEIKINNINDDNIEIYLKCLDILDFSKGETIFKSEQLI